MFKPVVATSAAAPATVATVAAHLPCHGTLTGLTGLVEGVTIRVCPVHKMVAPLQHLMVIGKAAFGEPLDRNFLFRIVVREERVLHKVQVAQPSSLVSGVEVELVQGHICRWKRCIEHLQVGYAVT